MTRVLFPGQMSHLRVESALNSSPSFNHSLGDLQSVSSNHRPQSPFDAMQKLKEYHESLPSITQLSTFFDSYQLIYNFSTVKINKELNAILKFLQKKIDKLDVTNIDVIEEAMQYQEQLDRIKSIRDRGTTHEVEQGESLEGIEEIIKSINEKQKAKPGALEVKDQFDMVETARIKQLHELMQKYNIKIDHESAQEFRQRGSTQSPTRCITRNSAAS